jgi:hypothetical protein
MGVVFVCGEVIMFFCGLPGRARSMRWCGEALCFLNCCGLHPQVLDVLLDYAPLIVHLSAPLDSVAPPVTPPRRRGVCCSVLLCTALCPPPPPPHPSLHGPAYCPAPPSHTLPDAVGAISCTLHLCSIGMSHMTEYTCCSSVAFEMPNENTFAFTFTFPFC